MAAVSKYEPLRRFLADRRDGEWRATLADVDLDGKRLVFVWRP